MQTKVHISGVTGFIGNALYRNLRTQFCVIGSARAIPDYTHDFFAVDWSNNRSYEVSDLPPRDVFIHCAGIAHNKVGYQDPDGQWRGNVLAAQNAFNAAR